MLMFVLAVLLLLMAVLGIVLRKTYFYVPAKELQRQAEGGDKLASTLYQAVAYGNSLRALLWLIIASASAGGFLLFARIAPIWLGFVVIALVLWLGFSWIPNTRVTKLGARLSMLVTPVIARLLNYLHPGLSRLADRLHGHYAYEHTGLYDSEDLLELVKRQRSQADSRIAEQELEVVERVLSARNRKVRDIVLPRAKVKTLSEEDEVGLVLLNELHESGQACFPVHRPRSSKLSGVLYLRDVGLKSEGKVADFMEKEVRYVHENDSLEQALQAFHKTKHQLFMVVNSFEEYVGVVTLESILHELIGETHLDDFDHHDDPREVAARHHVAKPEEKPAEQAERTTDEPAAEPTTPEEPAEPTDAENTPDETEAETPAEDPPAFPVHHYEEDEAPESDTDDLAVTEVDEEPATATDIDELSEDEVEELDPDNLAALDLPDDEPEAPKSKAERKTK